MKFNCDSKSLAYAARRCAMLARIDKTYKGARGVKIRASEDGLGSLSFSATDMNTTVTFDIPGATVAQGGEFLCDAASVAAFVAKKDSIINAHTTPGGKLVLKGGGNRIMLQDLKAFFPELARPEGMPTATIKGNVLEDMLAVSIMANKENLSTFWSGTLFASTGSKLICTAASTARLGYAWLKREGEGMPYRVLLPPTTVRVLPSYIDADDDVEIYLHKKTITFKSGYFTLVSVQLQGADKYPLEMIEEMVAGEYAHSIRVGSAELKDIIETCMVLTSNERDEKFKYLHFSADGGYRLLDVKTADESEVGQMNLVLQVKSFTGQPFSFALNAGFIKEVLRVLERLVESTVFSAYDSHSDDVHIALGADESRICFYADDLNAKFFVAPNANSVKVHNEEGETA